MHMRTHSPTPRAHPLQAVDSSGKKCDLPRVFTPLSAARTTWGDSMGGGGGGGSVANSMAGGSSPFTATAAAGGGYSSAIGAGGYSPAVEAGYSSAPFGATAMTAGGCPSASVPGGVPQQQPQLHQQGFSNWWSPHQQLQQHMTAMSQHYQHQQVAGAQRQQPQLQQHAQPMPHLSPADISVHGERGTLSMRRGHTRSHSWSQCTEDEAFAHLDSSSSNVLMHSPMTVTGQQHAQCAGLRGVASVGCSSTPGRQRGLRRSLSFRSHDKVCV